MNAIERPPMGDAVCVNMGCETWDALTEPQQVEACQICPIMTACREWNDTYETGEANTHWVYGGEEPATRIRRRLGLPPVETPTHCANGHEWTPENTYWWTGPERRVRACKTCRRDVQRRRLARRRAEKEAARKAA